MEMRLSFVRKKIECATIAVAATSTAAATVADTAATSEGARTQQPQVQGEEGGRNTQQVQQLQGEGGYKRKGEDGGAEEDQGPPAKRARLIADGVGSELGLPDKGLPLPRPRRADPTGSVQYR